MTGSTPLHIDRSSPAWALQEALDRLGHSAPTRRSEASIHLLRPGIQKGEASTPKAASKNRPGSVVSGNRAALDARATVLKACDMLIESLDMLDQLAARSEGPLESPEGTVSKDTGTPNTRKSRLQDCINALTPACIENERDWQDVFDEIVDPSRLVDRLRDSTRTRARRW